ncbi:MAG: hypothetical protein RL134_1665 [Actinomycetota bacterium]|jgi:hypothetical protein
MELYLRQHFESMLQEATGNFTERIVHRCGGEEEALRRLQADPESEGVWVSEFVDAFFEENLLSGTAGACFVLEALERRSLPADSGGPVAEVLPRLARAAFADVLSTQAAQLIQRQMVYR